MPLTRLHWRIGLPFAAFVLAGSIALLLWMAWMVAREERGQFESLARTNAEFINNVKLPSSERMARQLSEVIGVHVTFRNTGEFIPALNPKLSPESWQAFLQTPADGKCRVISSWETVAVALHSGDDLLLARPQLPFLQSLKHWRTAAALSIFWSSALIVAWLVGRGLVLPLRHLAAKLPDIEKPEPLDLPEALRTDEIGDVARAFVRTREALQKEREQRINAERLAVLGRMTASLAHEIQNPVAAIKMHAQLWGNENESAVTIASEAGRIESLVNQWMFLSKPEPPAMSEVDLNKILLATITTHRPQLEHAQVKAELHLDEKMLIQGDQRRLQQVFSNLIINAIQAMPRGGSLRIVAHLQDEHVQISFIDSGKGFSNTALEHFAEFFYSEKEGGMGIGLSVANEIIKAHHGELRAVNNTSSGACVTVILPAPHSFLIPNS